MTPAASASPSSETPSPLPPSLARAGSPAAPALSALSIPQGSAAAHPANPTDVYSSRLSHALQEPLRKVSSYLALLERRSGERLDAESREFLALAVDGARRMSAMVAGLAELARDPAAAGPPQPTSLDSAIAQAWRGLSEEAAAAGARLDAGPLPAALARPGHAEAILRELLQNALRFRAKDRPCRIEVRGLAGAGGRAVVSVTDNGIGVAPADAERMFALFAHLNPRGAYPGPGLGLARARRLAESSAGRLWAAGEAGRSTTLYLELPLG